MAYATFAEYAALYPDLGVQGTPAEKSAIIGRLLNSASAKIDAAAQAGGYTSPIVVSDLITDADQIAEFEELLRAHTITLARRSLPTAPDLTSLAKDQVSDCDTFLAELRAGRGLPVNAASIACFDWIKHADDKAVVQRDVRRWYLGGRHFAEDWRRA